MTAGSGDSNVVSASGQPETYVLVFMVLGVVVLVANMFILVLTLLTPAMHHPNNIHVMHLTAADLFVGIGLVFWASTRIAAVKPPSGISTNYKALLCTASLSLSMMSLIASVLILVTISVERYIKVTYPLRHAVLLSVRTLQWMRFFCWFLAVVCGLVVGATADYSLDQAACVNTGHTISVLILFSIGLLTLSFLHGTILRITFQQRRRIRGTQCHVSGGTTRADMRLAWMVALLFGLLFICWLPSLILSAITIINYNLDLDNELLPAYRVTLILRYFSTAINPFIFNTFNADFRSAIRSKMAAMCIRKKSAQLKVTETVTNRTTTETTQF